MRCFEASEMGIFAELLKRLEEQSSTCAHPHPFTACRFRSHTLKSHLIHLSLPYTCPLTSLLICITRSRQKKKKKRRHFIQVGYKGKDKSNKFGGRVWERGYTNMLLNLLETCQQECGKEQGCISLYFV
jgi:hypothetical protein